MLRSHAYIVDDELKVRRVSHLSKLFQFPTRKSPATNKAKPVQAPASENIIEDFLDARRRHQLAREQLRHLLNTYMQPHE